MNFLKQQTYSIILLIITTFSFITGFMLGQSNILMLVNVDTGGKGKITITQDFNNLFKNTKNNILSLEDFKIFQEAIDIISNNYYSANSISKKELVYGIIKGSVESLKDKHSEFFNVEETKKFNDTLNGDFEGIGAVISKNDFGVQIDRIIAGSPAKEFGLLAGDIIIKANNGDLKDLTINEAVNKIKGPAGTKVRLEIIREGEKEIIIKEVIRKKITIPSVDSKIIENNIGYIMLSIFGENTGDEFEKSLNDLKIKNIKGLIIDLRDNGGGYLQTAVSILSNFVEKDKLLVTTKEKNILNNKAYFSLGNKNKKIPIVILINGNSASASEITAGALKDYNLAILVGEKSYGKGSVQEPFILSDGSELKITVAKWYTPLDNIIDGIGIKPDIESVFTKDDYNKKFDRQLDKAKEIMNKIIENNGDINKTKDFYIEDKAKQNKTGTGIENIK